MREIFATKRHLIDHVKNINKKYMKKLLALPAVDVANQFIKFNDCRHFMELLVVAKSVTDVSREEVLGLTTNESLIREIRSLKGM